MRTATAASLAELRSSYDLGSPKQQKAKAKAKADDEPWQQPNCLLESLHTDVKLFEAALCRVLKRFWLHFHHPLSRWSWIKPFPALVKLFATLSVAVSVAAV